jgi:hypothetical protein
MWPVAIPIRLKGTAIRLFFFLLVFANLLFFAWTKGYFGASDDGHEPQRLAQQLNAEKLRIVREVKAPVAKKVEMTCRVVNGLAIADAEALKTAVEAAGAEAKVSPLAESMRYLAVIADLANKAAADKKVAELNRFGLKGRSAVASEGGRFEIILDSFDTEAAALEFLQEMAKRGIKSARLEGREQPVRKVRVETRGSAPILLPQLPKLIEPYADATIGECAP